MTRDERTDINWALWVAVIVFALGFLLGKSAHACESYEECIKGVPAHGLAINNNKKEEFTSFQTSTTPDGYMLKAIAYKLDEISKKLDRDQPIKWSDDLTVGGFSNKISNVHIQKSLNGNLWRIHFDNQGLPGWEICNLPYCKDREKDFKSE